MTTYRSELTLATICGDSEANLRRAQRAVRENPKKCPGCGGLLHTNSTIVVHKTGELTCGDEACVGKDTRLLPVRFDVIIDALEKPNEVATQVA